MPVRQLLFRCAKLVDFMSFFAWLVYLVYGNISAIKR